MSDIPDYELAIQIYEALAILLAKTRIQNKLLSDRVRRLEEESRSRPIDRVILAALREFVRLIENGGLGELHELKSQVVDILSQIPGAL